MLKLKRNHLPLPEPEPECVSIPVSMAVYCENCHAVSNGINQRCTACGSEATMHLTRLFDVFDAPLVLATNPTGLAIGGLAISNN